MVNMQSPMGEMYRDISTIEHELQKLPPVVIDEFRKAILLVEREISPEQLYFWGGEGVAIGQCGFHGWKAAAEYFYLWFCVFLCGAVYQGMLNRRDAESAEIIQ